MALQLFKIASAIVGSSGAASIAFSSIPQGYSDLKVVYSGRNAANAFTFSIGLNGTTVTGSRRLFGTANNSTASSDTYNGMYTNYSSAAANVFGSADIYIPNYTSSVAKTLSVDAVAEDNYTSAYMNFGALLLTTTSPVTSLSLIPESGNFAQHSTATLYGIL